MILKDLKKKKVPKVKKNLLTLDIKDVKKQLLKKKNKNTDVEVSNNKKRSVVAFDIGSSTIKIAQGVYHKNKLTVNKLIKIRTPSNSVEEGEILLRDSLSTVIGDALDKFYIKAKDGICTTNPTTIISREIDIPKVDEDEIETVVRYEIQQYLPINLDDCILQTTILNEFEDKFEEKTKLNVRVIAYPKKIALEYYKLLEDLKLRPYVLDVNFNALNKLGNLTGIMDSENNKSIAVLDIGLNFIDVNIYNNGSLDFTRRIKGGAHEIDNILIEDGAYKKEEIVSIKINKLDLNADFNEMNFETRLVLDTINGWIEKIEMIFRFYKNKSIENDIEKVILIGGSSKINGISKYMSENFHIEVTSINNLSNISFRKAEYNGPNLGDFANAIGSIIRL